MLAAYYLSGYLWLAKLYGWSLGETSETLERNVLTVLVVAVITCLFYPGTDRFTSRGMFEELKAVLKKNIMFAALIAVYEILRNDGFSFRRSIYVITVVLAIVFMQILHSFIKHELIKRGKRNSALRMLVITTRERAEQNVKRINTDGDWQRRIDGFVVTDQDMVGQEIDGIPVVANSHTFVTYMKNEVVDEVYLDINYRTRESLKPYIMELEDMGITVHIKLELLDSYKDFDTSLGHVGNIPVVTFAHRFYDYKALTIKRAFDILGSLIGMLIMFIAMIFVAPAIKIESPGPLFFKQKRVGKNGRYFYVYKFRSMYIDAEERKKELMAQNEMSGLMFKMTDDPRITKVGKFIRKTSIDELPQFINIFLGDMSLVGTRPPTVAEFKQYEGHHKRRLSMKPGLTGMWQAYGRNTVQDFEDVVKMDLDYIDHWSLALDIKILFKTVVTVLTVGGK
jgi:exopolysaccharide biosynthesis polyprenyl glycosylphosphotransferase